MSDTHAWNAVVEPGGVGGAIDAIASKSAAHRMLILAALADAPTQVYCTTSSRDIEATRDCLEALGARIDRTDEGFDVTPIPRKSDGTLPEDLRKATLDCGESGSTLRFMLPVSLALGAQATLDGHGRLPQRPLSPLRELLTSHGCVLSPAGSWPLVTEGRMTGGTYRMRGDVSSQFTTGLLLAAPACKETIEVKLDPPIESRPYLDLTCDCLAEFDIAVQAHPDATDGVTYRVPKGARVVTPGKVEVEGDWSNAAFWLAAGAIGTSPITVRGLRLDSSQGDRAVCELLSRFGAQVELSGNEVCARPRELHGIEIDAGDIPDLCVPMAVVASCAQGETRIVNAGRLRAKESDRLTTVAELLRDLGVSVQEGPDFLTIEGQGNGSGANPCLRAATIDAHNDHRIAMAAAIASTRANGPVTIEGAQAVEKSYPHFFEDWRRLGGDVRIETKDVTDSHSRKEA